MVYMRWMVSLTGCYLEVPVRSLKMDYPLQCIPFPSGWHGITLGQQGKGTRTPQLNWNKTPHKALDFPSPGCFSGTKYSIDMQ